eukprot:2695705-Pleurochrysis_carterae.AAC.1
MIATAQAPSKRPSDDRDSPGAEGRAQISSIMRKSQISSITHIDKTSDFAGSARFFKFRQLHMIDETQQDFVNYT